MKAIINYVLVFVLAMVMAIVIRYYYLETYLVESISMNKTLFEGDKLLVAKSKDINAGDVVVFHNNQGVYVKRLIGLPGDTVQIINRMLYVNHKKKFEKYVNLGTSIFFRERVNPTIMTYYGANWSIENFGPYIVPRKGSKIILNKKNLNIYQNILEKELRSNFVKAGLMNQNYVFKNNYYFMLGDNRLFSEDSRMYGPVTSLNVIGIAKCILYSENRFLERLFKKL